MSSNVLIFNNTSLEDLTDVEAGLSGSVYKINYRTRLISDINKSVLAGKVDVVIALVDRNFDQFFACLKQVNTHHPVPFIVFTYVDDKQVIRAAIQAGVSAFIIDGLEVQRVLPILETAQIRFQEQQAQLAELEKMKASLSDRKIIEKAKGLLMQRSKIGENEAYQALRKMAMNKNMKMADLARGVLSAAELI